MRKSREETAESRKRILSAAADRFLKTGIEGTGLAELMAAAGMTPGGFYRHFESKDQVVRDSVAVGLADLRNAIMDLIASAPKGKGLQHAISNYLSTEARDSFIPGCPVAALGGELGRGSEMVREAASTGMMNVVDTLAAEYSGLAPIAARKKALMTFATMVGALTIARIVTDPDLSTTVLREARKELAQ